VIDIGLEGSMLTSAYFGVLGSFVTGNPWIGLAAAIGSALLMTLIFGWFTVVQGADQVVVGTAVNLLALGLTGTLYRAKFGQSGALLSVSRLPSWHGIDPLLVVLMLSVPVTWNLLFRSGWGLAARGAGQYPKAVEGAGFSVRRIRLEALALGGLFAGLAGAYLSLVVTGSFAENMTAGRGFVAIAMVTFGRWRPGWVFAASLLIGFAGSLEFWFQSLGWKAPYQIFVAAPYVLALLVLVAVGRGSAAPRALGRAYRSES
jgi:ABC-type uncharacterized transport system permease subunit